MHDEYKCSAGSLAGFIQMLATVYVRSGYVHAAVGVLPAGRDPTPFDRKQVERYQLNRLTAYERMRRKRAGYANIQYLRLSRFFVILATDGEHEIFRLEEGAIARDLREKPLVICGYSLRVRQGHVHVRIAEGEFQRVEAYLLDRATKESTDKIAAVFNHLPFERYAPVVFQLRGLLKAVNHRRKVAGLALVPQSAVRWKRRLVRPFESMPDKYEQRESTAEEGIGA
jgi:hypothetical protein